MESRGVFIVLAGIGLLHLFIAVIVAFKMRRPRGNRLEADGVVVDQAEHEDDTTVTYSPVVRFTSHDGAAVEFDDAVRAAPPLYKSGERVTVYYAPDDPRDAHIKPSMRTQIIAIIMLALGAIMVGIAWWGLG